MALDDYGGLIQSGMQLIPDLNKQLLLRAQTAAIGAQAQANEQQAAADAQKLSRAQQFQHDISTFDGSPASASKLIMQYPEYADQLKKGWDVQDGAKKQSDLTSLGEIYSAATGGNWALAKRLAHERADAEKANGHSDPAYDSALAILDQAADGDPTQRKVVLNLLGTHLAAVTGPEHFGTVYGSLKGGYTLDAGATRFDDNGQIVAQSPYLKTPDGGILEKDGSGGASGGVPTGNPSIAPKAAAVASALASSGLPAPVVAGFMGNFHAEGGYEGAQGDGGSASGIAQWRDARAANFARIIGKPTTEATPEEQAKFVAWEMENPEQAGMTVAQRDKILAAKTPAQAAALIDQYYERSNGRDRHVRMSAAQAFANAQGGAAGAPVPAAAGAGGSGGSAPPGYHVLVPGSNTPDQFRNLTPDEIKARNLDPTQQYQVNTKNGQLTTLGSRSASTAAPPGNPDLSGPAYIADLKRQNPSLAAQVQGVLDTRLAYPPATARSPQAQQLRAAVLQVDPNYDEQAYARRKTTVQQYTPGHAGPGASMLSAATLINHMYDLAQAARDLPDHSTRAQNAMSAWWGSETNAPWLIKFNEGRKFVSSELPKFLNGKAPTEGEQHDHYESYAPSKGKTGIQNALSTDVDYLYGRYQPLIQAYKDNTGKDLNIDNYAPGTATRAKAAALEYYRANGSLPTVVTSPAQAAKLPHGAVFATPDGRILTRH